MLPRRARYAADVTERTVRALVLGVLAPLAVSVVAGIFVLGPSSDTLVGHIVYVGFVGAFAVLVWKHPYPGPLVCWAIVGAVAGSRGVLRG